MIFGAEPAATMPEAVACLTTFAANPDPHVLARCVNICIRMQPGPARDLCITQYIAAQAAWQRDQRKKMWRMAAWGAGALVVVGGGIALARRR